MYLLQCVLDECLINIDVVFVVNLLLRSFVA